MINLDLATAAPQETLSMEDLLVNVIHTRTEMDYVLNELAVISEQSALYTTLGMLINAAEDSNVSDKFIAEYGAQLTAGFSGIDLTSVDNVVATLSIAQEGLFGAIGQAFKNVIAKVRRGFAKMFSNVNIMTRKTADEIIKLESKDVPFIGNVVVLGMHKKDLDKFLMFDFVSAAQQTNKRILQFRMEDIENTANIKGLTRDVDAAMIFHRVKRSKVKLSALGFDSIANVHALSESLDKVHDNYEVVLGLMTTMEDHLATLAESTDTSTTTTTTTTHSDRNSDKLGQSKTVGSTKSNNTTVVNIYQQIADTWYRYFSTHEEITMQLLDTYRSINKTFK